jgi:hypothetical protein
MLPLIELTTDYETHRISRWGYDVPPLRDVRIDIESETCVLQNKIESTLAQIEVEFSNLDTLSNNYVSFFSDNGKIKKDFEFLTIGIKSKLNTCYNLIKQIDTTNPINKNIYTILLSRISKDITLVQTKYNTFTEKIKMLDNGAYKQDYCEPVLDENPFENQDQIHQITDQEKQAIEKQKQIQYIYDSVVEINSLANEIDILVVEQGKKLGNIELHIINGLDNVKRGNEIVEQVVTQHNGCNKCWIILVIVVILSVLILFFSLL